MTAMLHAHNETPSQAMRRRVCLSTTPGCFQLRHRSTHRQLLPCAGREPAVRRACDHQPCSSQIVSVFDVGTTNGRFRGHGDSLRRPGGGRFLAACDPDDLPERRGTTVIDADGVWLQRLGKLPFCEGVNQYRIGRLHDMRIVMISQRRLLTGRGGEGLEVGIVNSIAPGILESMLQTCHGQVSRLAAKVDLWLTALANGGQNTHATGRRRLGLLHPVAEAVLAAPPCFSRASMPMIRKSGALSMNGEQGSSGKSLYRSKRLSTSCDWRKARAASCGGMSSGCCRVGIRSVISSAPVGGKATSELTPTLCRQGAGGTCPAPTVAHRDHGGLQTCGDNLARQVRGQGQPSGREGHPHLIVGDVDRITTDVPIRV
jgi:hypothetical protein